MGSLMEFFVGVLLDKTFQSDSLVTGVIQEINEYVRYCRDMTEIMLKAA